MNLVWSKHAALRAGYGAIIAVLVLCAFEAYRIQVGASRKHLEIYRHFVERDEALAVLRRNLWLAGNYVRDFFINPTPAHAALFARQLGDLNKENEAALHVLEKAARHREVVPSIRQSLAEFQALVAPLPRTMAGASPQARIRFLDLEIVPRRGELYKVLRALSIADEQQLQDGESEFAAARRGALQRLLPMLGLGLLLSVLVARISLRRAENLEKQAELHFAEVEQARAELQRLSARLLEIEEEGRRRLSRELHDEIGQTLALLQIEISHAVKAVGPAEAQRARLDRARELAERSVQTVRNMSVLLRPALLDDLGLVPALQFQLEDFSRRSGIACDFQDDCVAGDLPDVVKTCVYRVMQEALHNAEKHSGARQVRASVRQYSDRLVAEIEDNGCGFATNDQGRPARSTGLGLLGIRERAAHIGGALIIDSAPGRGTRIVLIVPVPAVGPQVCDREVKV